MIVDQAKRIELLETGICLAISLIARGYVGEAVCQLDRVLEDPDMELGAEIRDPGSIDEADLKIPF